MNQSQGELFDLLGALCNGTMTPEEHARLEAILAKDREARRFYFGYLDLHLGLRQLQLSRQVVPPSMQLDRNPRRSSTLHRRHHQSPGRRSAWTAMIVAAGVVVGIIFILIVSGSPPSPGAAQSAKGSRTQDQKRIEARPEEPRQDRIQVERPDGDRQRREEQPAQIGRPEQELKAAKGRSDPEKEDELRRKARRELGEQPTEAKAIQDRVKKASEETQAREDVQPPKPPPEAPRPARQDGTVAALATVVDTAGRAYLLRGTESVELRAGQDLHAGQGLQTGEGESKARVKFGDGSILKLGSLTKLGGVAREAGWRITLERGEFRAEVAKQPQDRTFVFDTPHAEATVLGTTLRIVVDPDPKKGTWLGVEEGKVRLKRKFDGKIVDVSSGHFAVAATGVEFVTKPVPIDEIVLSPRDGKIVGNEWRRVNDEKASTGIAWEAPKMDAGATARFKNRTMGYVVFTFRAEANREYRVWIRGCCMTTKEDKRNASQSDAVLLESLTGVWSGPSASLGRPFAGYNGYSHREGYWWVGGEADGVNEGKSMDLVPYSIRFDRSGVHTVRLFPDETPIRIDAIWLSTTQKDRPEDQSIGPRDNRK